MLSQIDYEHPQSFGMVVETVLLGGRVEVQGDMVRGGIDQGQAMTKTVSVMKSEDRSDYIGGLND